ncbi:MAG: hypothetical protein JNL83_24080 [Myxococcales bacterium]|nr:hypothetical protein [Myxococcales bacterium]
MRWMVVTVAILGVARPARAELWASSMGNLLKDANRVEVIDVTGVKDRTVTGTVALAVKSSAKPGTAFTMDLGFLPVPKAGERMLVICDYQCPRAVGVERAGAFQMTAQEPMDGAFITPNVVETASLALLAKGQPAPDLCVRGLVELLDDPKSPTFEVKINPANGSGSGTIATHRVNASMTVVWFASETGAIAVKLAGKGAVELVAHKLGRDQAGCFSGRFFPTRPLARTARSLDRALDGIANKQLVATGTLTVPRGAPVPAGKHELRFTVTADGYLELASDLAEGRVSHVQHDPGHFGLGFPTKGGAPNDPELFVDFGIDLYAGYEHGAALAKAVRMVGKATVYWYTGGKKAPLGEVTLAYLPERATPRAR